MSNWPIVVGAKYGTKPEYDSDITRTVTFIAGDFIHYEYGGSAPSSTSSTIFRQISCPFYESPIPKMTELLKRFCELVGEDSEVYGLLLVQAEARALLGELESRPVVQEGSKSWKGWI
jgi:hypothetical protein